MTRQARDPLEVLTRAAEGPDLVLRYADHADALVDVFLPPALGRPEQPAPLVVFVHGGFWREQFDRVHTRPLAGALARDGFVVATPEFRRVGGLGGWPTTAQDVVAALAGLPESIEGVAPGRIEATKPFVLAGHSAGGHLAMWAGLSSESERVARIVALAPVSDVHECARRHLGDDAAQALLDGQPEDAPEAYAEADVLPRLPGAVPVTIMHGTDDDLVPADMSRRVARDHPEIEYVELAGVDHFALIDPLTPVYTSTVLPLLRRPLDG